MDGGLCSWPAGVVAQLGKGGSTCRRREGTVSSVAGIVLRLLIIGIVDRTEVPKRELVAWLNAWELIVGGYGSMFGCCVVVASGNRGLDRDSDASNPSGLHAFLVWS